MLIQPISTDELPGSLARFATMGTSSNMVVHGLGRCPDVLTTWLGLYEQLVRRDGALAVEMKELIRRQIAALYDCGLCTSFINRGASERGLDDDKASCVLEPDDRYSDAERAMLGFTRKVFTGPEAVDEAAFADVRQYFDEAQITEMGFVAALLTGWGRLTFGFQVVNDDEARLYEVGSTT